MTKPIKLLKIVKSKVEGKKFDAHFEMDNGKIKVVPFGAQGYSDFTQHKDTNRRALYLKRHKANEDWSKADSAGALSRFILWGDSPNIKTAISQYKERFNL